MADGDRSRNDADMGKLLLSSGSAQASGVVNNPRSPMVAHLTSPVTRIALLCSGL